MSACSPHPYNIMVSPLNIHRVVFHQSIHDNVRPGPPVINIPYNMQMIHYKPLDQVAESNNKFRCAPDPDNGMDDLIIIAFLVGDLGSFCDQFLNNVGKILGQGLPHLGPGVLGGHLLGDLHQTMERDLVPVLNIILLAKHDVQLFLWIIDQCCKGFLVFIAQCVSKFLIDLTAHCTGSVLEHMVKLLILSVNICQKVFCSLGQVQDRLKINDLRRCCRYIGILV